MCVDEVDELATPQEEALQILTEVIRELTSSGHDLKAVLRKCQHACRLLGWEEQAQWFHAELNGYPEDAALPDYRLAQGLLAWKREVLTYHEALDDVTERAFYPAAPRDQERELSTLEVWWPIEDLITAADKGYRKRTGETRQEYSRSGREQVNLVRMLTVPAPEFARVVKQVEERAIDFASRSYTLVRYGNVHTDIWNTYRQKVEEAVRALNLGQHLDAISAGMQSVNPEAWRNAVFGCRNLLDDLAFLLWQDPRDTYDLLPGSGRGGKLDVSRGRTKNRLAAYLHQKVITGAKRKHFENELERLGESIASLIEYQNAAHGPIGKDDARSVAIGTYVVLGELVTKTDMQPIEQYVALEQ